jgi:hypothetical protein
VQDGFSDGHEVSPRADWGRLQLPKRLNKMANKLLTILEAVGMLVNMLCSSRENKK